MFEMRYVELVPGRIFTEPRKKMYKANKNLGQNDDPVLIVASDQRARMSLAKWIKICSLLPAAIL